MGRYLQKRLATGSLDKTAKIWDLESGKQILTLSGQKGNVYSVAFSPDGKRLAIGSKIWDLESGKEVITLSKDDSDTESVAFSPDGKRLATGSKIWDLESGKEVITLSGHTDQIHSIAFSPDGKKLATGSWDKTVKIWELTPEGWLASTGKDRWLSPLSASQLEAFNIEGLLDFHPNNEQLLLQTGEVWQIAAFADLYINKIRQTDFPKKEEYERALRLYEYCVKSGEAPEYFGQRVEELKKVWKEKTE